MYLKLAQVLQLAASLFVLHFVSWTCRSDGSGTAALAVRIGLSSYQVVESQMSGATNARGCGKTGLRRRSGLELGLTL